MDITFTNIAPETAVALIEYHVGLVSGDQEITVTEQAAPEASPVQTAAPATVPPRGKDKKPRRDRSDKGLGREPYGPRTETAAPVPAVIEAVQPSPSVTAQVAATPKAETTGASAPAEVVTSTVAPQAAPVVEASVDQTPVVEVKPIAGGPTYENAKQAMVAVFNGKGMEVSKTVLTRFGLARLSELPPQMEGKFITYCQNVMAGMPA